MMTRRLTLTILGLVLCASPSAAQTLNCDSPKEDIDRLICSDPRLQQLHTRLEAEYLSLLPRVQTPALEVQARYQWLKERDKCKSLSCLTEVYERRQQELLARSGGDAAAHTATPSGEKPVPTLEPIPLVPANALTVVEPPAPAGTNHVETPGSARADEPSTQPEQAATRAAQTTTGISPDILAFLVFLPILAIPILFGTMVAFNYSRIRKRITTTTLRARAGNLNPLFFLINTAAVGAAVSPCSLLDSPTSMTTGFAAYALFPLMVSIGLLPLARHIANSAVGVQYDAVAGIVDMPRLAYFRQQCSIQDVSGYTGWMDSTLTTRWEGKTVRTTSSQRYHLFVTGAFGSVKLSFLTRGALHSCAHVLDNILAASAQPRETYRDSQTGGASDLRLR